MTIDNNPDVAPDSSNQNKPKMIYSDNFSESGRLTRGYLPVAQASVLLTEQCWFGPCIRVVDADKTPQLGTGEQAFNSFYDEYGIRCSMTAVLRMRAKTCNDPVFPYYTVH